MLAVEARTRPPPGDPHSPWNARDGWWLNATRARTLAFSVGEAAYPVVVRPAPSGWTLDVGGESLTGAASFTPDDRLAVTLDAIRDHAGFTRTPDAVVLRWRGETWRLSLPDPEAAVEADDAAGDRLLAPIPGQVTAVAAAPGQIVKRGDILVILEAMKTVFRLAALADAVVAEVPCRVGDSVEEGQILVSFVKE